MYNSVITLIDVQKTIDEYGDAVEARSERNVFASLKSVSQSEFYQAHAVGLKPEVKFVLADYLDYKGEMVLRFQDFNEDEAQEYSVIRTYRNGTELELVCKRGID